MLREFAVRIRSRSVASLAAAMAAGIRDRNAGSRSACRGHGSGAAASSIAGEVCGQQGYSALTSRSRSGHARRKDEPVPTCSSVPTRRSIAPSTTAVTAWCPTRRNFLLSMIPRKRSRLSQGISSTFRDHALGYSSRARPRHDQRLNSNENGWVKDMYRCAIMTPAMFRAAKSTIACRRRHPNRARPPHRRDRTVRA